MVFSTQGPHSPLLIPESYYHLYDPEKIPEPPNWSPTLGEPSFLNQSYYRRLRNEWGEDFEAWRQPLAVYWGYASYIDSLLGRFLSHLEGRADPENTAIAMLSDHGEMMGQHGLWQKFCPYEEAIRVPWVMQWPGRIEAGTRCRLDVSHPDAAATLLAVAGIDPTGLQLEGENVLPYVSGEIPAPESRDCFAQYNLAPDFADWHGVHNWRMILRRPWKYVLHENGEEELYDLERNPYERENQAGRSAPRAVQPALRKSLLAWSHRTGDPFAQKFRA